VLKVLDGELLMKHHLAALLVRRILRKLHRSEQPTVTCRFIANVRPREGMRCLGFSRAFSLEFVDAKNCGTFPTSKNHTSYSCFGAETPLRQQYKIIYHACASVSTAYLSHYPCSNPNLSSSYFAVIVCTSCRQLSPTVATGRSPTSHVLCTSLSLTC
jgi:hypothetical protein